MQHAVLPSTYQMSLICLAAEGRLGRTWARAKHNSITICRANGWITRHDEYVEDPIKGRIKRYRYEITDKGRAVLQQGKTK